MFHRNGAILADKQGMRWIVRRSWRAALLEVGVIAFGALQAGASTSLVFSSVNHPGTSVATLDGGVDISPYTGILGGIPVTLYCDDFNNDIVIGSTSAVTITNLVGGNTSNNSSLTRFATANYAASVTVADHANALVPMPAGTTLYDEMAWLFTQLGAQAGSSSPNTGIEAALQEAAWEMSTPSGNNHVPTTYSNDAKDWIWLATQNYTRTNQYSVTVGAGTAQDPFYTVNIVNPNYAAWMILDDSNSALNAAETTGQQEQMAYYGSVVATNPEPATWGICGIGILLIFAGYRSHVSARRSS